MMRHPKAPTSFFGIGRDRFAFRAVDHARLGVDRVLALGHARASRIFTRFDAERVFAAARAADRRAAAGEDLPLLGLTVSIKDLFDEAGEVTTVGSALMLGSPPAASDAVAVTRLLASGALPFGRTVMSEFAYSGVGLNPYFGTTGNGRDPARIPGGSSSGAGVSVALGLCDAALGSDTGGSIRIPAALNGLAGFKPSQVKVPLAGGFPLAPSFDSFGPIAPRIAVCAALHAALSDEPRPAARRDGLAGARIGVVRTLLCDGLDAQVGADFGRALAALSRAGADLSDVAVPPFAEAGRVNRQLVASEAYEVHSHHLDRLRAGCDPNVLRRILSGGDVAPADREALRRERDEARAIYDRIAAEFDALIAPTVAVVAPTIEEVERDFDRWNPLVLRNPSVVNFVDGCGATVPMSAPDALATGLTVMGRNGYDWGVLALAEAIEPVLVPG